MTWLAPKKMVCDHRPHEMTFDADSVSKHPAVSSAL